MTLASARLKASVRFPPLRGMYQRGGTCKGCDNFSAFAMQTKYLALIFLMTKTVNLLPGSTTLNCVVQGKNEKMETYIVP